MGRIARRNSALEKRINDLKIDLHPFIRLPNEGIHPAFPKNVMAYMLLTEDELDSLAHFYHQSTPGPYTKHYPCPMVWDKDFLARTPSKPNYSSSSSSSPTPAGGDEWLTDLIKSSTESLLLAGSSTSSSAAPHLFSPPSSSSPPPKPLTRLSKQDRVRIKRRKFGKFIGFRGMRTPTEEVFRCIRWGIECAVERGRAELRRDEEGMMGRRKLG